MKDTFRHEHLEVSFKNIYFSRLLFSIFSLRHFFKFSNLSLNYLRESLFYNLSLLPKQQNKHNAC